jgi:general secretion pathway protein D
VPVATGSFQPGTGGAGVNPLVNTQFNYLDVGVNIDTSVREQEGRILLNSSLDISALVEHKQQAGSLVLSNPTVAQIRISVSALVTPGKPTMVASIDDPVTQHHFEVEAQVTKAD